MYFRKFKEQLIMNKKIIAFDADDTLWHNEPYFDEAQAKFCELFQDYASKQEILQLNFKSSGEEFIIIWISELKHLRYR